MTYLTRCIKVLAATVALGLSALAFADAPAMEKGGVWTDHQGMTLYTFKKDSSTKSECYEQCAKNWPPFKAEADAKPEGKWTVIERQDGTKQWAYDGKPLYTFIADKKAGDMTGDNKMDGAWKVAKPD